MGTRHIQNDTVGILHEKQTVLRATGQIEHHPRAIRTRPQSHGAHLDGTGGDGKHGGE
jgi:hypothetical protein